MAEASRFPIVFDNVSYQHNGHLLMDKVSCQISDSGISVVMGPNGAGKSLFLRLACGLLSPTTGKIQTDFSNDTLAGFDHPLIVFQRPVMLRRSAAENIAFVLHHAGWAQADIPTGVADALKMARLENLGKRPAKKLSGGEQQRLALARALAVKPPALLLDEATANLDPTSTFIFENMIRQSAEAGTKIIFVTHDVRQAKRLAQDIIFVHHGTVLTHKPAKEFFKTPGSEQAQAYLDGRLSARSG